MFCPSCGEENVGAFGYCNSCGSPLTPMPEPRMQETATQETATPKAAPAASPRPSVVAPQTIAGRKKWNPGVITILVIGLTSAAGAVALLVANHESAEQHIGRLMREASGLQPVKQAFFASDRQVDDAFREQFRNMIRLNREFLALENKVNANEIGKIGSSESFTDPAFAAEGIRQLHASYIFEKELEEKVLDIAGNLRHTIDGANWSASHKAEAREGFERGLAASLQERERLLSAEQRYIEAVDNLYEYCNGYYAELQLENGEIKSTDESVLRDFNSKMKEYNARRKDLLQAKEEFTSFQRDMLNKMGMSSKDAGLR